MSRVTPGRPRTSASASSRVKRGTETAIGPTPITALTRGRMRLELIRDLALGEWSPASIAKRLGVDTEDIVEFAEKYANDVAEVRQAMAGQLAIEVSGLWIGKKQNRIAELQADFEELNEVLDEMRNGKYHPTDNDGTNLGSRRHRGILKSKMDILHAVSEELSPRGTNNNSPEDPNIVHYVINAGDATEALR